jgi:hypothetical protein
MCGRDLKFQDIYHFDKSVSSVAELDPIPIEGAYVSAA